MGGGNYQQLINDVLLEYIEQQGESFEVILRRVIREELQSVSGTVSFFTQLQMRVPQKTNQPA
jgi:hypothetical protein